MPSPLAPQRFTIKSTNRFAVHPPIAARAVVIGNGTTGDLQVDGGDAAHYLVVSSGYERAITLAGGTFVPFDVAFYLTPNAGSGTVVLLWLQ